MVAFRLVPGEDPSPPEVRDKDLWILKTSNYIALPGDKLLIDTTGGSWTLILPTSPTLGQEVDLLGAVGLDKNPLYINSGQAAFEGKSSVSIRFVKNDYLKLAFAGSGIGWVTDTDKIIVESIQTQPEPTPTPKPAPDPKPTPAPTPLLLDKYPGANLAYSLRKLSNQYNGTVVKVASNNTQIDVNFNNLDANLELPIVTWYDQSGKNLHSTSNTRRPALNKLNNKYYVASFDNNAILSIPAFDNSLLVGSPIDISLFIILQAERKSTTILDNSYPSTGQISWHVEANGTSYFGIENATTQNASLPSAISYITPSIISLVRNSNSLIVCQNGEDKFTESFSPSVFTSRTLPLNIGSESGITPYFLKGCIAELIIYPKALENYKDIIDEINSYYQIY